MQQRLARNRVSAIGDDLVDIHVRLGAAAGLPDGEGKLRVELAGRDLIADLGDQRAAPLVKLAEIAVGKRRRLFQHGEGADDLKWHAVVANRKILKTPLGLRAPKPVGRDLYLAE